MREEAAEVPTVDRLFKHIRITHRPFALALGAFHRESMTPRSLMAAVMDVLTSSLDNHRQIG